MNFKYGKKEMEYLKSRDRRLGEVIDSIGRMRWTVEPDSFRRSSRTSSRSRSPAVPPRRFWQGSRRRLARSRPRPSRKPMCRSSARAALLCARRSTSKISPPRSYRAISTLLPSPLALRQRGEPLLLDGRRRRNPRTDRSWLVNSGE